MKTILRKKNNERLKQEFNVEFNITGITEPRETTNFINHYEEIMKTQNKKIIEYVTIQRKMLRKFKGTEDFIENLRLNRSTIYFKIELYKFLKKFRLLKNSTLSSHYFKNHLK